MKLALDLGKFRGRADHATAALDLDAPNSRAMPLSR